MRGRINALVVILLFLAIFMVLLVIKKHVDQSKLQAEKNVTIIRKPYLYNVSVKVAGPGKLEFLINVTRVGNIFQVIYINISKLVYPNILTQVKLVKLQLKPNQKTYDLLVSVPVNPKKDEKVLISIKDSVRGPIASYEIPLYHHVYQITSKLLSNYSLLLKIHVVNYTLLADKLRVLLYFNFPTSEVKKVDYTFTVAPSLQLQIKKQHSCNKNYCVNFTQYGNNITIVFTWNLIGFPWTNATLEIIDTNLQGTDSMFQNKALIYETNFKLYPEIVKFGESYETANNLILKGEVVYGDFDKSIYNFTYYAGGTLRKTNLECKVINDLTMCYGIVSLTITNHDSVGHNFAIDPGSIICVNNLGAIYSWSGYKGILGDTRFHLEPLQSKTIYLYCLMPYKSRFGEIYFRFAVDGKWQELVLSS